MTFILRHSPNSNPLPIFMPSASRDWSYGSPMPSKPRLRAHARHLIAFYRVITSLQPIGNINVAGIDVGGPKKGFHAVVLRDGHYLDKFVTSDARNVADWCRRMGALAVGVDAPSRWRTSDRARTAEVELMQNGIRCFYTPTLETAKAHPGNYFGWMYSGAELFRELETTHPIFSGRLPRITAPVCFETFPHAIACALAGTILSGRKKRAVRRELLRRKGIKPERLPNMDMVDAALCALAAHHLVHGSFRAYGAVDSGLIVVPRLRDRTFSTCRHSPTPFLEPVRFTP